MNGNGANLAPVVLFTYNRLRHTKQTVESLQKNRLAEETELIIYSDAPKSGDDKEKVWEVREYIQSIQGFKSVSVILQNENLGLAESIISGVTTTVNEYGKIIVLEDDIVTSENFLEYMNSALNYYEKETRVWHIGGWNYPIKAGEMDNTFLWRVMNCWGWGTWRDRWANFEKNPQKLLKTFSDDDIRRFNLDDSLDFWIQVKRNARGELNTWAIFWYASIFENNGLCLSPAETLVNNIGFDGTGEHKGFDCGLTNNLSNERDFLFPSEIVESVSQVDLIKEYISFERKFRALKENENMMFSSRLGRMLQNIDELNKGNNSYVLYGAGSGCLLVKKFLKRPVDFIVDRDILIENTILDGIPVFGPDKLNERGEAKVIITVFGREREIVNFLNNNLNVPLTDIILVL